MARCKGKGMGPIRPIERPGMQKTTRKQYSRWFRIFTLPALPLTSCFYNLRSHRWVTLFRASAFPCIPKGGGPGIHCEISSPEHYV